MHHFTVYKWRAFKTLLAEACSSHDVALEFVFVSLSIKQSHLGLNSIQGQTVQCSKV